MNEAPGAVLAVLAGLLLGGIFFFGLWWTVGRSLRSRRPALWIFGSLLVRMTVALGGLYLVGRGHAGRLLLCLLGMMVARFMVLRLTSSAPPGHTQAHDGAPAREVHGAS
jgi:F1F0 ATPase subunit 2